MILLEVNQYQYYNGMVPIPTVLDTLATSSGVVNGDIGA